MFSSALKSFTSNISSNYTLSAQPTSTSGPWKVFDAKRKQSGKAASVFVLDKKSLEPPGGGLGGRSNASSTKRLHEEVLERLKKEASSLARLRHPSILELVEPVEETRSGGLMFATEPVVSSLASLLQEKDEQERSGGAGSRRTRRVVDESEGGRKTREFEIDELEIQKGLLQLAKGLEFLHESAGLVHANLTPEAIIVNTKGDWKIAGLSYCGPHQSSTTATSLPPINLHEVLNHDPRLPRMVQLDLDFTSPDFVLDNSLVPSSDMFSLGLLIVALYNSPHTSPLSVGGSLSAYKRAFSSSSSIPTQSNNFMVPSSHPLPHKLASELLPRLITRRPAQRLSAREFQEASYFDNILVSTIRFLEALPAKTASEKVQFLRGLPKIMSQFPRNVLEKKVLPALLEEMKDKDLIAPIMTNMFAMIKAMPSGKRSFTEKVVPKLREIFITNRSAERDTATEAGLMILLENMQTVAENCSGKEFRDDILPILHLSLESPTHGLVDAALGTLPHVLPVLDFTTIKNELFPVIATVFAKTSSLNIKIRGLQAFYTLIGGTNSSDEPDDDDLNGISMSNRKPASTSSSAILDKYTVQEKVVPLLKGIKTKEPGVMMAALKVFGQVARVADSEFLAIDVLPIVWSMSLGPLLNLQQFQAFMTLVKNIGEKVEKEQTRKLQETSGNSTAGRSTARPNAPGRSQSTGLDGLTIGGDTDFETLVSGRKPSGGGDLMNEWGVSAARPIATQSTSFTQASNATPTFSWQTPAPKPSTPQPPTVSTIRAQAPINRTVTPDLASFTSLTPSSVFSQPLQPIRPAAPTTMTPAASAPSNGTNIDWSSAANSSAAWASPKPAPTTTFNSNYPAAPLQQSTSFGLPPPPTGSQTYMQPQQNGLSSFPQPMASRPQPAQQFQQNGSSGHTQKTGLDKYESLI
jgi:SCY1-like protein 2